MSKQTAIQQAINRIKELQNSINSSSQQIALAQAMDILEDFKPIFEQQIIDARQDGFNRCFRKGDRKEVANEQYYNETFKD
jgi:hypothetical protein